MAKVTDRACLIQIYIEKGAAASQNKRYLRSFLLMGFQKPMQWKIGDYITVIADNGFVLVQKVLDIF